MKKLFLLLALVSMFATACEEGGIDEPTNNPTETPYDAYIALNREVVTFSPDGDSIDIKVYSNYAWELTNNCDWVTISVTSGDASEDGTTITLSADLTYDDREGTITFSSGKAKKLLVVSQSLKEVIIADENNTFGVPVEGGNVIINYQTSVECEVVIPEEAQSWISLTPETRGLVSSSATLNIAPSNTGAKRSAVVQVVKVGDNTVSAEYTITQDLNMDYVILYTTTDGKIITPYAFSYISNTYEDGVGMLAFDNSKVPSIEDYAFYDCILLTSITIPDSVTAIGNNAFISCTSLTSITIPDSVTEIGSWAFGDCDALENVIIGNGVTEIGEEAFRQSYSLKNVTFGNSVTTIGDSAFHGCDLRSITIPDSVTVIEQEAFYNCTRLTALTIGNGVTEIGHMAFGNSYALREVYCKPITPPTIASNIFPYINMIYVPTESVDEYKSAWSSYKQYIEGYDF